MLYSIGYQKLTVDGLLAELAGRRIKYLLDVRSKPVSRKKGFSRGPLSRTLKAAGIAYDWKGDVLGGLSPIDEIHIKRLACWQMGKAACLMCLEADPFACHRHYELAVRLLTYNVQVEHIKE